MKTVTTSLDVPMPVAQCCKCGKESACRPLLRPTPDGSMLMIVPEIPFMPIHLGQTTGLLCVECLGFVEGALVAMGLQLKRPEPRSQKSASS